MFSNWQGLNILSYGNWIVSPLMEMCQTCSYTQQTADIEWRSTRAREWDMERRGKEILSYYLLGCREDVMMRKSCWVMLFGYHQAAWNYPISNIYLVINPLLAPGLSESCWKCSHHNPPGYLVRSDCRLRKATRILSSGSHLSQIKSHFLKILGSSDRATCQSPSEAVFWELQHCIM